MVLAKKVISSKIVEKVLKVLGKEELEKLARSTNFVKRESLLGGFDFVLLNMNSIGAEGYSSLVELCTILCQQADIQISKQGLDNRYHIDASSFMSKVLAKVLSIHLEQTLDLPALSMFKGIYIRDATSSQLPACLSTTFKGSGGNASVSGVKVDLVYDILSSDISLQFRNGASNDSNSNPLEVGKDNLYLQDLGYFKLATFAHINENGAYFISRYKQAVNIYNQKEDKCAIPITDLTKGMQAGEIKEHHLFLGSQQRLPVRLIIQKLPNHIAQKRKKN